MSKDEARAFTKHLNALLSDNTSYAKLEKTICENNLLYDTKEFSDLFKNKNGINELILYEIFFFRLIFK